VRGCSGFLNVYFGRLFFWRGMNKKKPGVEIEIDIDTDKQILFEYREGAEYCIQHGLIFPPGYVILTASDEQINGVMRERHGRFSSSSESYHGIGFGDYIISEESESMHVINDNEESSENTIEESREEV
jgi:hypothetical protein